jgi:hypothetical protein
MTDGKIIEVQEQIIEQDGVRYHLVNISNSGLTLSPHQPWCQHCDGLDSAPKKDEDRLHIFDNYCYGNQRPLLCLPDIGLVYKRMEPNTAMRLEEGATADDE